MHRRALKMATDGVEVTIQHPILLAIAQAPCEAPQNV